MGWKKGRKIYDRKFYERGGKSRDVEICRVGNGSDGWQRRGEMQKGKERTGKETKWLRRLRK